MRKRHAFGKRFDVSSSAVHESLNEPAEMKNARALLPESKQGAGFAKVASVLFLMQLPARTQQKKGRKSLKLQLL